MEKHEFAVYGSWDGVDARKILARGCGTTFHTRETQF